jgi:hypothetical protein
MLKVHIRSWIWQWLPKIEKSLSGAMSAFSSCVCQTITK